MTELHTRLATSADAERIYAINRGALDYDFPLESTRERLEKVLSTPGNRVGVACDESGRVIGYIHCVDYENLYSASLKNIMALAVDPARQGSGAGRLLLGFAEDWARACGCEGVRLVSGFDRVKAHQFYQHCGYTLRKEEKNFIKRW